MRKPKAGLVVTLSLPFVAGCFAMFEYPLPEPSFRSGSPIDGVVLGEGDDAEYVAYARVDSVSWEESSVTIAGAVESVLGDQGPTVLRTFDYADISHILIHEIDATKSSILVAGSFVGAVAVISLLVTGKSKTGVPIG